MTKKALKILSQVPLLFDRIMVEPTAVVGPVIDVIDWNTFQYLGNPGEPQIGGFDWRLVFTWHPVPEYEQKRRSSPTDVIRCVVHTGTDTHTHTYTHTHTGTLTLFHR